MRENYFFLCQINNIFFNRAIGKLAPNLEMASVYGGAEAMQQINKLKRGVDVVCATPGRLRDLIQRDALVSL